MNQALKTTRIDQFLGQPNAKTFAELQHFLYASESDVASGDPSGQELRQLTMSLDKGDFSGVLATCDERFDRWCLSPRFHYLRGQAALQVGDQQLADESKSLSQECLYWLCESGDGTFESPYRITYQTDEVDILMAFSLEKRCQQVVDGPNGRLDVVTLHNGVEIWFDVSNAL